MFGVQRWVSLIPSVQAPTHTWMAGSSLGHLGPHSSLHSQALTHQRGLPWPPQPSTQWAFFKVVCSHAPVSRTALVTMPLTGEEDLPFMPGTSMTALKEYCPRLYPASEGINTPQEGSPQVATYRNILPEVSTVPRSNAQRLCSAAKFRLKVKLKV